MPFIHEAEFWDRFDRGSPPVGLTLLMAANALRSGHNLSDCISLLDITGSVDVKTLLRKWSWRTAGPRKLGTV